jgi:hypothetical protein
MLTPRILRAFYGINMIKMLFKSLIELLILHSLILHQKLKSRLEE